MSPRESKAQMFVAHAEPRPDGLLRFWCENLLEDRRCGIDATRPEMCRAYPSPVMFERGGGHCFRGAAIASFRIKRSRSL